MTLALEWLQASWRPGGKSEDQWRASLRGYAMSLLSEKPVNEIATSDVMEVLLPIWSAKTETARRVRQRIRAVMKWTVAQGCRESNPAGNAIVSALWKHGTSRKHFQAVWVPGLDQEAVRDLTREREDYRRRGWDSNPRRHYPDLGFQDRYLSRSVTPPGPRTR